MKKFKLTRDMKRMLSFYLFKNNYLNKKALYCFVNHASNNRGRLILDIEIHKGFNNKEYTVIRLPLSRRKALRLLRSWIKNVKNRVITNLASDWDGDRVNSFCFQDRDKNEKT